MRLAENRSVSAVDVRLDQRAVLLGQRLGHDRHLLAALQILERRRLGEREVELRRVEHVKHDDVVAAEPQRPDRLEHRSGSS